MATLTIIGRDGRTETVVGTNGKSAMKIIHAAGFYEVLALCGGNCSCATCHVYVEAGTALPSIGGDERDLLEASDHRTDRSRLACQIRFDETQDGLVIRIAPED